MNCKPRQIIGNIFNLARDYNRYCGRVIGNLGANIPVIGWILDLSNDTSDFQRDGDVNIWGYIGDPSSVNPPQLISVPAQIPAIPGGRIVSSQWDDVQEWGAIGDSFTASALYQPQVDLTPLITMDATGGVSGNKLSQIDARIAAYISGQGYVYTVAMGGINDIKFAVTDISDAMLSTLQDIVGKCLSEPTIPVVCTIPPFKTHITYTPDRMTWANSYDAKLKAYASDNNIPLLDLREVLSEDDRETLRTEYDSGDGLHPSAEGHIAIGNAIINLINPTVNLISTNDLSGKPLGPSIVKSTRKGLVRIFIGLSYHEVSTAYPPGDKVIILTTAGNKVYMTSSGGTSDVAAPTVIDSDIGSTVIDNDITWSIEDYSTIEGELLEDSADNFLINFNSPVTQTTASLGIGFYTLQVFGSGSALASGGTATITGAGAVTEGSPNTIEVTVAGTVTITVTGSLDYFQLEDNKFTTSLITTAGTPASRVETLFSELVGSLFSSNKFAIRMLINPYAGQSGGNIVFGSQVDSTHYTDIFVTGGNAPTFRKTNGSAVTLTGQPIDPTKPFWIEAYVTKDFHQRIRSFNVGATIPVFKENTDTQEVIFGSDFEIGSRNNAFRYQGIYQSIEISDNKDVFGW